MFGIFKKDKKEKPVFRELQNYPNKDKYFQRTASWRWLDNSTVVVTDPNRPRVLTLDPWTQQVFLAADGKKTIAEFTDWMAEQYDGKIPQGLDETIIYQIEQLLNNRIIKLSDIARELGKDFLHPQE